MAHKTIIGVMGPGEVCPPVVAEAAYRLGGLLAREGWVTLCGGRDQGVMDAVSRGAKAAGGLTVGILPVPGLSISEAIDIPIITDVNMARNNINVVSSAVVVACGIGIGTASEIALALCAGKHVIMLLPDPNAWQLFHGLRPQLTHAATTPEDVIPIIRRLLSEA